MTDPLLELIEGDEAIPSRGRKADLTEHLSMLRREFVGKPRLHYEHATLCVLARRRIEPSINVPRFFALWHDYQDALLASLDARWLVSACDTFLDLSNDPAERQAALAGTLFMNTIKLYETERAQGSSTTALQPMSGAQPLFDGLTTFVVGHGDMVMNLLNRVADVRKDDPLPARITHELVRRARADHTVFARIAAAHVKEATRF